MHSGVLNKDNANDIVESYGIVYVSTDNNETETLRTDLHVMSCESSEGTTPGKAIIEQTFGSDYESPSTLNINSSTLLKFGSRVRIVVDGVTIFLGSIQRRMDQGARDSVTWVALDESIALAQIPIRGALVFDKEDLITETIGNLKYISRYTPHFNPGGMWNCTGMELTRTHEYWNAGTVVPIFAPYAELGQNYEKPDENFQGPLKDGVLAPWTPRRALDYLCFIASLGQPTKVAGINLNDQWRSLYGYIRVNWDPASISSMVGVDPGLHKEERGNDPLDRKLPSMNMRGKKMLQAIQDVLDAAGTHGQKMNLLQNKTAAGKVTARKSDMAFYPKGFSGLSGADGGVIPIYRSGTAVDVNTAFDFTLDEDATMVGESCLVEGAPVKLETVMEYTGVDDDDTLIKAWSASDETAFLYMIRGFEEGKEGQFNGFAKIPPRQGQNTNLTEFLDADGQDGRPLAYANYPEAIQLARASFPEVYRAFKVKTTNLDALQGQGGEYANTDKYPRLTSGRPILPEQLQFLLKETDEGDDQINWLKTNYPIRVQVKEIVAGDYIDAPLGTGVRITDDGTIWLDGLAESCDRPFGQGSLAWCIYSGSLYDYKTGDGYAPILKDVRINAAVPMDHRVTGYDDIRSMGRSTVFARSYTQSVNGPNLLYIDSPEGYTENHQVNSSPSVDASYLTKDPESGVETTVSAPLTRLLPPGTEAGSAGDAAKRKLSTSMHPKRRTSWKMVGIRPERAFGAGDWISKVKVIYPAGEEAGPDTDYDINASVETVTFDFENQVTIIGGLTSELT